MDTIAKTRWGDMPMTDDLEALARELYRVKQSCHNWETFPWEKCRGQVRESWLDVARKAVELLKPEVARDGR